MTLALSFYSRSRCFSFEFYFENSILRFVITKLSRQFFLYFFTSTASSLTRSRHAAGRSRNTERVFYLFLVAVQAGCDAADALFVLLIVQRVAILPHFINTSCICEKSVIVLSVFFSMMLSFQIFLTSSSGSVAMIALPTPGSTSDVPFPHGTPCGLFRPSPRSCIYIKYGCPRAALDAPLPRTGQRTFHIRLCHLQNIHPLKDLSCHVDHLIGKHIFLGRLILLCISHINKRH